MNWLKKGPELKLPKLKMPSRKGGGGGEGGAKGPRVEPPAFLADLYYDMRDRRLLPLLALVLVAIVAVPFLMGSDPEPLPPLGAESASPEAATAKASTLTVVEATPGLRDYRKRLSGRSKTDPFKQQYAEPGSAGGAGGGSGSASSAEGGSSSGSVSIEVDESGSDEIVEEAPNPGSGGGSGGSSPGGSGGGGLRLIEFRFTIQITHSEEGGNGQRMSEPELRRRIPALTQLPGKKTAVATVAGVNLHNGKAFFLVSDDVTSLDGEFVCKTRTADGLCELLEVEAGFPLEFVYGPSDVRYVIKVIDIDAVWAGKPNNTSESNAAFGGPAAKVLPRP